MTRPKPFYDDDLAYIHDVGFSNYALGAAPGLLEILKNAGIHEGLVVDLGCGGGLLAQNLVEAGYQIFGLDISPSMIELARERVPSGEFETGSIWSFPLPTCRAVTAWGEVVCYRSEGKQNQNLGSFFRKVFNALKPGGLLIFDVAEIGLLKDEKSVFVERDNWACLVRFEYDEQRNRLTRHITTFRQVGELYRRSHERHVQQLYSGSEVAGLLRKTGFRVRTVRKIGEFALLPKRIGFIAKKP